MTTPVRLLVLTLATVAGLWCNTAAQSSRSYSPKTIYVRFADDGGYHVAEKRLIAPAGRGAELDALATLGWWSRVHTVPDEKLQELRRNAARNLGRKIPDPSAEFHFHLYNPSGMEEAMKLLRTVEDVRKVLRIPVPRNAQAPDLRSTQTYIADTASGINADSVYFVYHNRGAGIRICDVEYSFKSTHTDLPSVTVIGATPADPFGDTNHGTAVMGEIASKNDTIGTTGIASDSRMYFAAACTAPDTAYDLVAPITAATSLFSPGDVILLEQQIEGPNYDTVNGATTQIGLVPVEWYEPYYDAIVLAVGNNIAVVEAAGNGQQNLDGPAYSTGNGGHYPFLPANNSGAIMVGAGSVGRNLFGTDPARSALYYSNYGSRLDVQANGERVTTTGYGDAYSNGGPNEYFTYSFSGTSSASPIVTGVVALLQSVFKNKSGGSTLTPAQVRNLLKTTTGKEQRTGRYGTSITRNIGPLPDVYAATRKSLATLAVTPAVAAALPAAIAYPNPTRGQFSVALPAGFSNAAAELSICSMTGRTLRRYAAGQAVATTINADISDLPDGIYQLHIVGDLGCQVQRLLLAH